MRRNHLRTTIAVGVAMVTLAATAASAAVHLPAPGTATQVHKLVAASASITKLSPAVQSQVAKAAGDNPGKLYPATKNSCTKLTSCVFGDVKASKTIVLMGDSHAQMWIPAMNRIGQAHHMKVILLFLPQCPAASLDVWLVYVHAAFIQCTTTRKSWISQIVKLHPADVLLSDRTYGIYSIASNGTQTFTDAQWQAGMETTLTDLKPSKAKVAILGDLVTFDVPAPTCLAAFPTDVQKCAVANPNPDRPAHQSAERAAAKAESVRYIDPTPWLCTKTCSAVIGHYIAYYDQYHISVTYDGYLSGVLQTSLKGMT